MATRFEVEMKLRGMALDELREMEMAKSAKERETHRGAAIAYKAAAEMVASIKEERV